MSNTIRSSFIRFAVVCCSVATAFSAGAAQSNQDASRYGKPLTTDELFQLYQGRSWLWKDGAGYFSPKQRRFAAWTFTGYGDGRWFLTDPGKLCFKATWIGKGGNAPALTCFSHRKNGANVYQKREPDGEWYLFKHTPVKRADEYAKVRRGDHVGARLTKAKAQLSHKN